MLTCATGTVLSRSRALADAKFRLRVLRADLGNFGPVHHRYVDGFVISAKNSGSHWLKYMLSLALAEQFGLAAPAFTSGKSADAIVGRANRARSGRPYPQIATSHTIPSILLAYLPLGWVLREPPIVVLVRDIPEALRSHYRKWRDLYNLPFAEFLQGDLAGKRFMADPWWYVHFFNRWGLMQRRHPNRILIVHYEDLLADTEAWLRRVAAHLRLDFDDKAIDTAVAGARKDLMRDRQDPNAGETIVPYEDTPAPVLSPSDQQIVRDILHGRLRYRLGYASSMALP